MYYRKPKPETMKKNRENNKLDFKEEIKWFKENLPILTRIKNKFLIDMYQVLVSGSRKVTPKMGTAIKAGVERCKHNAHFNPKIKEEAETKLKPILGKINVVLAMAEAKGDYAVDFIKSVETYVKTHYRITKKQMAGLNKVHKRVSEDLFNEDGEKK